MLLLPEREVIRDLLRTGDYTISSSDEHSKVEIDQIIASFEGKVKRAVINIDEDLATHEMKDRQFDVILCFDLLKNVQHPEVAISNLKKLLKPGAAACFIEAINPGPRLSMLGCSKTRYVKHTVSRRFEAYRIQTGQKSSKICYIVIISKRVLNLQILKIRYSSNSV